MSTYAIHFRIERVKSRTKNNGEMSNATAELKKRICNGASISGHGGKKQVSGKAKSSTSSRGRKRKSGRLRFILVLRKRTKKKKTKKKKRKEKETKVLTTVIRS